MNGLLHSSLLAAILLAPTEVRLHAQTPLDYRKVTEATQPIGEAYFAAYLAQDWDKLGTYMAESISWDDPTSALVFGPVAVKGREHLVPFLKQWNLTWSFSRTRAVFTGNYAIFEGKLDWHPRMKLASGKEIVVDASGSNYTVILRIEGGKVVEHRDYLDYQPFLVARQKTMALAK